MCSNNKRRGILRSESEDKASGEVCVRLGLHDLIGQKVIVAQNGQLHTSNFKAKMNTIAATALWNIFIIRLMISREGCQPFLKSFKVYQ